MTTVAALAYVLATPDGQNRRVLDFCLIAAILLATAIPVLFRMVVDTRWEAPFFYCWSAASAVLIFAATEADGGPESPLSWLLVLPVVYASISYPAVPTAAVALGALLGAFGVMLIGSDWDGQEWFRVLFVLTFDVMAVASALNRRSYEVAEGRLTLAVTRDGLTNCLNNAAFQDRLHAEAARAGRTRRPFSLVMSDGDHFKRINDTYGHHVGDETLRAFADALLSEARASDAVARIGGDEFAILLPETSPAQAVAFGNRLLTTLHRRTLSVPATLSLGIATWVDGEDSASATLRRADEAMYEAKHLGGDRLVVWHPRRSLVTGTGVAATP